MKTLNNMNGLPSKALILDGSGDGDREAQLARETVQIELEKAGAKVSCHVLRDIVIAPCTGCLRCWTNTPGECAIDDEGRKICADMARSDLVVLITPVTYGGCSSELKKGMDRLIPVLLPYFKKYGGEVHHPSRYGEGWNLFGVGTLVEADKEKERLFKELIERNSRNMHSKRQTSCVIIQGANEVGIRSSIRSALKEVAA